MKILLIISALIAVLAIAGLAWAGHRGICGHGDLVEHVAKRISHRLDLNVEQTKELQDFAEQIRGQRDDWAARRSQTRQEIDGLLVAPTLDRERLMALIDERHQDLNTRVRDLAEGFADFSDSLEPEQRTRLAELIGERMTRPWGPPRWVH